MAEEEKKEPKATTPQASKKEPEATTPPTPKKEKIIIEPFDMTYSDTIGDIAAALAKAQGTIRNGKKDSKAHNYKYMELDQVIDIVKEALSENEIAFVQSHEFDNRNSPSVITTTILMHSSGQWIKSRLTLPVELGKMINKSQAIGIACTYGRRYALQSMVGIAAEKDTDGAVPKEPSTVKANK